MVKITCVRIGPMFQIINLNILTAPYRHPAKREKSILIPIKQAVEKRHVSQTQKVKSEESVLQHAEAVPLTVMEDVIILAEHAGSHPAPENHTEKIVETPAPSWQWRLLVETVKKSAMTSPRILNLPNAKTVLSNS